MLAVAASEPPRTSGAVLSKAEPPVCAPIDANGNLTADGTRTLEWDARNQLLAVDVGTHRSEFSYDGQQRRIRVIEKESSVVQSDTKVIWCGSEICEERAGDGTTVNQRPFKHGEQVGSASPFFGADHLGSVTEVTDSSAALLARYAFDPWGRRVLATGTDATTLGYTGHRMHEASALALTMFRAYDPAAARWLSEDPLLTKTSDPARSVSMPNRYRYASNSPVRWFNPTGLISWTCNVLIGTAGAGAGVASIGADCTSECIGGRQLRQRLAGVGAQANLGPLVWSAAASTYVLEDPYPAPYSWSLPGLWTYAGGSAVFWSYSRLQLGAAKSKWGVGEQIGVDVGLDAMTGATVKVSEEWLPCC